MSRQTRKAFVIEASEALPEGRWATYTTVGVVVYGHEHAYRTVGNILRNEGLDTSAHRVLEQGGRIPRNWRSNGGGPEECERRLRREGTWDEAHGRARAEREVRPDELRELIRQRAGRR